MHLAHDYSHIDGRSDCKVVLVVFGPLVVGHWQWADREYLQIDSFAAPWFGVVTDQDQFVEFLEHLKQFELVETFGIKHCAFVGVL